MPVLPKGYQLKEGETATPVLWVVGPIKMNVVPDTSDEVMDAVFYHDGKTTRRIRTFAPEPNGVHYLATRGGLPLHTDPAFTRYTHQLVIRNDGWVIVGMDQTQLPPPMVPGTLVCLDTWSPHTVIRDDRIAPKGTKPLHKVQIVVDRDQPLTPKQTFDLLVPRLRDKDPLELLKKQGQPV